MGRRFHPYHLALAVSLALVGCGGTSHHSAPRSPSPPRQPADPPGLRAAEHPVAADFPAPRGRSIQAVANTLKPGSQLGLAGSVFLPGANRVAFGVIDNAGKFIYGPTAIYIAEAPNRPARGPYPAAADSMVPQARFRSKTAAADSADIKAIYAARVPFRKPGTYVILAVTQTPQGPIGAPGRIKVSRSSPIPNIGDRPPRVMTDTVASAHGNLAAIDTRDPHDNMHTQSLAGALGKREVVLLFSTPQLCQSRVCGPVTDIELQMQAENPLATFIHQEVYAGNQPKNGLRPPLRAFHLQTEPWLFVFNVHGRVAARLEGAFGVEAFRQAVAAGSGD